MINKEMTKGFKIKDLILVFGLIIGLNSFAQDPNYSQFYNNPIYYNPAMTAINNGMAFRMNARNLWGPIPGRFNTYSASLDAQSVYKMGLGAYAYSDVAGEGLLRTGAAYITYSYRAIDSKNFILQAGASGGFVNKSIDYSKLVFSDQLDETQGQVYNTNFINPNRSSVQYADFHTGIVARFNGANHKQSKVLKRFMVTTGAALHHLSQPNDGLLNGSSNNLPMRLLFHGNVNLLINEFVLAPGAIYEIQNQFKTFSVGVNFVNQPLTVGLWMRNRTGALDGKQYDSFIFTAGCRLPEGNNFTWRVMYNYDITISRLKTSSYGTHEVSLVMEFGKKVLFERYVKARSSKRTYQCPKDFSGGFQ